MGDNINLNAVDIKTYILKIIFIQIFSCIIYFRINNFEKRSIVKILIYSPILIINSIIITYIKNQTNMFISFIFLFISLSIILKQLHKNYLKNTLINTIISIGMNYVLYFLGMILTYIVNKIHSIENDYINLLLIVLFESYLLHYLLRIKRLRNGIAFLYKNSNNEFMNLILLNMFIAGMFTYVLLLNINSNSKLTKDLVVCLFIYIVILFLTITKSIEAYYKQKLLIQDLNETKKELEDKKKEVEELEAENLSFSKKSHSLAHKQKSLEFKINKLLMKLENAEELGLQEDLKSISKQLQENSKLPNLDKTGIMEIDDMLSVMQEECRLNGIDFVLQLKGNIYQMTNNYITKEELSILIADHIKDAIIAINHIDNINKSIMVRLGKIDDYYGLYIYDSGVEFSKEVLSKLGKQPITSYPDEGGTGMGFMNTFDTLKKHNASLIIESIGKPSKDNYTKVIKIIFDNKNYYSLG